MDQIQEFIVRQYSEVKILMLLGGIFLGSFLGLITTFFASLNNYKFLRDKNHLLLGLILPPIGFIIVYVIGSNLALSLGMIGALSIIRFRTPVRSSYELVIYFLLLTIGISLKVNFVISVLLTLFSVCCFLVFFYIPKGAQEKIFEKNYSRNITLTVQMDCSDENEKNIINNEKLISMSKDKNNVLSASLDFNSNNELQKFLKINEKKILTYEIFNSDPT